MRRLNGGTFLIFFRTFFGAKSSDNAGAFIGLDWWKCQTNGCGWDRRFGGNREQRKTFVIVQ